MFGLSFFEILFLLVMALIVIGPKQLPQVARTIARFINEFRRTTSVMTEEMKASMFEDQRNEHRKTMTPFFPPEPGIHAHPPAVNVTVEPEKKAPEDV